MCLMLCSKFKKVEPSPPVNDEIINPCLSSPCGPNAECIVLNENNYNCKCLSDFIGNPPNCRPECISNSECTSHLACINRHCKDPCVNNPCGLNAECHVVSHTPICECIQNYVGDPFIQCSMKDIIQYEQYNPCIPSPCGPNAVCREQNGIGSCQCALEYFGNPYEGCRPECTLNSDCPLNRACIRNKCQNPCPGVCAQNAECQVVNHLPMCVCRIGYTGDSYNHCSLILNDRKFEHLNHKSLELYLLYTPPPLFLGYKLLNK